MGLTDSLEKLMAEEQKRDSVTKLKKSGINVSEDKSHLQHFATPGFAQAQVMAKIGKSQLDASSIKEIADSVLEQAQKTKDGDFSSIEVILHSQIAMLNSLSTHFMNKAIAKRCCKQFAGYDSGEVLTALPHIPNEFAELSLKCQAEMRKCIALLHELKNPKKPSQFIKTYVNQQLNQLQVEQEQLKQRLEEGNDAPVEFRSERTSTTADPEMETLGTQYRSKNSRGKGKVKNECS
ncbi:hypothetical protein ANA_P30009 (plasmid) [Anabaena sp. 90]|uniref:hypothetical protein n=1 Tax=Anabaena sp. 90 TaxID=46234 RepID=UPI00029B75BD|nr:hypothetical protein [Anabaena sp. 90]AFW97314.1 hypothetical protein ANA_P30009 [Anabaena sp. 90]